MQTTLQGPDANQVLLGGPLLSAPTGAMLQINSAAPRPAHGQRSTCEVACPRSMVGRVIGKNGETIKALQTYTGALIQIDQSTDPTRVTISGTPQSLSLAMSMVTDICKGTFKGFALLRQLIQPQRPNMPGLPAQPRPVYAPGYGLIPPSQLYGPDEQQVLQATPVSVMGTMPGQTTSTLVAPPGYQYVQTTPLGVTGDTTQVVLGLPPGLQTTTTLGHQDGTTLLSSMPVQQVQQLPVQQVYSSVPLTTVGHAPGFGQVTTAYYPSSEFAGADGLGLNTDHNHFGMQPAHLAHLGGSNATKVLGAGAGGLVAMRPQMQMQMRGQHSGVSLQALGAQGSARTSGTQDHTSTSSWVAGEGGAKVDGAATTLGQSAVKDLLGGGGGPGSGSHYSPLAQQQLGGNQLLQVIGHDGVSYYLRGSNSDGQTASLR